jgi:hypothetical protein
MKTLLSLFDYTGQWSEPFAQGGWNVILWDIKHDPDYVTNHQDINDANAQYIYEHIFENYGTVDGILAAVPCTDFAVSGARWFKEKDKRGDTEKSIELVYQTLRIIDLCMPDFWVIENPISRIHKLVPEIGQPVMYFNPCDFGDPYTKRTALYGQFNTRLKYNRVEPTQGSKMHRLYGGKSERTKELRSVTPKGFAKAFYEANKDYKHEEVEQLILFN